MRSNDHVYTATIQALAGVLGLAKKLGILKHAIIVHNSGAVSHASKVPTASSPTSRCHVLDRVLACGPAAKPLPLDAVNVPALSPRGRGDSGTQSLHTAWMEEVHKSSNILAINWVF